MLDDNGNSIDLSSFSENKAAGKVNFNTASSKDYITNEAYKTLRTNILFCSSSVKTIVLTSSRENEGKSTVSAELAKSLAEAGKRTLLIDADMRKSVMLRHGGKARQFFGLSELLSGQVKLNQALYNTQEPYFDVIFSGMFPPNPVELLNSDAFKNLLETAKSIYDYVIIDSPPLGTVIDAAVIAANCDGAVLVISPGKISSNELIKVKEQLSKSGCKILGAILNDVNAKRTKYYRKYEYGNNTKK